MTKKLTQIGNSLGIVFDKGMLEQLQIDADTPLEVSTDGGVIVVLPVRSKKREALIKELAEEAFTQYAGVFRKLTK